MSQLDPRTKGEIHQPIATLTPLINQIAGIITGQRPDINGAEARRLARVITTNLHITREEQDRVARLLGHVPKHHYVTPWEANQ